MTDRERPDPDRVALSELADRIDRIAEASEELRELGEAYDVPAVERNAKRIEAVVEVLEGSVPRELTEE